jgi:hypothetical protein
MIDSNDLNRIIDNGNIREDNNTDERNRQVL